MEFTNWGRVGSRAVLCGLIALAITVLFSDSFLLGFIIGVASLAAGGVTAFFFVPVGKEEVLEVLSPNIWKTAAEVRFELMRKKGIRREGFRVMTGGPIYLHLDQLVEEGLARSRTRRDGLISGVPQPEYSLEVLKTSRYEPHGYGPFPFRAAA